MRFTNLRETPPLSGMLFRIARLVGRRFQRFAQEPEALLQEVKPGLRRRQALLTDDLCFSAGEKISAKSATSFQQSRSGDLHRWLRSADCLSKLPLHLCVTLDTANHGRRPARQMQGVDVFRRLR